MHRAANQRHLCYALLEAVRLLTLFLRNLLASCEHPCSGKDFDNLQRIRDESGREHHKKTTRIYRYRRQVIKRENDYSLFCQCRSTRRLPNCQKQTAWLCTAAKHGKLWRYIGHCVPATRPRYALAAAVGQRGLPLMSRLGVVPRVRFPFHSFTPSAKQSKLQSFHHSEYCRQSESASECEAGNFFHDDSSDRTETVAPALYA